MASRMPTTPLNSTAIFTTTWRLETSLIGNTSLVGTSPVIQLRGQWFALRGEPRDKIAHVGIAQRFDVAAPVRHTQIGHANNDHGAEMLIGHQSQVGRVRDGARAAALGTVTLGAGNLEYRSAP